MFLHGKIGTPLIKHAKSMDHHHYFHSITNGIHSRTVIFIIIFGIIIIIVVVLIVVFVGVDVVIKIARLRWS